MRRRIAMLTVGLLSGAAAPAHAGDPIMPLSQVQRGMSCTGYTVVRGTEISAFDVEIFDVVAGQSGAGAQILLRVSGAAVASTGIASGFSGSPVYCPDGAGTQRVVGAISSTLGEYGNNVGLATPIEEVIGESPDPPRAARRDPKLLARARPVASPLTISGLSQPLAQRLIEAGRRIGRPVVAAPAGPLGSFPVQSMQPGSSVSFGLSSGDLNVGAIGTVAYTDGSAVWAFGHPVEGTGARSLFLQDAYVFTVISNPLGIEGASSYKLAGAGHDVGMFTNDGLAGASGRVGTLPPSTAVRVMVKDTDTGRRHTIETQAADEADLQLPSASSPSATVAPLAVLEAGSRVLRGIPSKISGSMCFRIELREREQPIRVCNTYISGGVPAAAGGGLTSFATDLTNALAQIDGYQFGPIHVDRIEADARVRRGLHQAYLLGATLPRRVRRGQRVTVSLTVRRVNGAPEAIRTRIRVPRALPRGPIEMKVSGTGADLGSEEIIIDLGELLDEDAPEETRDPGDPGPRSLDALVKNVEGIHRFDGVSARFTRPGRNNVLAEIDSLYRNPDLRVSGKTRTRFRVP